MNITIYLSLEAYNDGDFDVKQDYYKSDEEYFDTMRKEVDKYSNVAYEVVSNLGNIANSKTAKFSVKKKVANDKSVRIFKAENVKLIDENGEDETIDNLVANCISQDIVVYKLIFDTDSIDPEFEEDYLNWVGEHRNINQYIDKLGEDKVWANEPTRTFKIEFINKSDEKKYAELGNCKIIEMSKTNAYTCVILAEKINLIEG